MQQVLWSRTNGTGVGSHEYRDETLDLLCRAACHCGNALRDEEAGLTVGGGAAKRNEVKVNRIVDLRRSVHQVAGDVHSVTKQEAGDEDGALRALLHFEPGMSEVLRHHVYARLAQV